MNTVSKTFLTKSLSNAIARLPEARELARREAIGDLATGYYYQIQLRKLEATIERLKISIK